MSRIARGANGIWLRNWSDQIVPWDAIACIGEKRVNMQKVLAVHLKTPDDFTVKQAAKIAARLNKASGDYGDMTIIMLQTNRNFDDLSAAVSAHKEIVTG